MHDSRNILRKKRHLRIRKKIFGTLLKPRLTVFKSNYHFYAQIIDDEAGHTLVAYATFNFDKAENVKINKAGCIKLAVTLAKLAKAKNIDHVVFDRSGYIFHGKIKAFVDTLRSEGIKI